MPALRVSSATGLAGCKMRIVLAMLTSSPLFRLAQRWCAVLLLCSVSVAVPTVSRAGDREDRIAAARDTPEALKNGELVYHSNYCGVGNRAGAPPIDALDVACMHHDACTPTGKPQTCACNAKLVEEAGAVARDPRQPAELQSLAALTATAAAAGMTLCVPSALVAQPKRAAPAVAPAPVAPTPVVSAPATPAAVETAPVATTAVATAPVPPAPVGAAEVPVVEEPAQAAPGEPMALVPPSATPATTP